MFVFDAEQLELEKLDKESVSWVTIRGNHVPIPKNASRERKAQAIKEWFANKKKDLPTKTKTQTSYYSAKFEHEKPKIAGTAGTGEGQQVHTHGQYTQSRSDINKRRYFERFANKTRVFKGIRNRQLADGYAHGLNTVILHSPEYLPSVEKVSSEEFIADMMATSHFNLETLKERIEYNLKSFKEEKNQYRGSINSVNYQYIGDNIQRLEILKDTINNIKKTESELFAENGYVSVPSNYMVNGKAVFNNNIRINILRYKAGMEGWNTLEDLKENIAKLGTKEAKEFADSIKSDSDIQPAKAQMSKIQIPAEKYFLDEDKSLNKQSGFVKSKIVDLVLRTSLALTHRWSSTVPDWDEYKNNEVIEKARPIIEKALNMQKLSIEDREKLQQEYEVALYGESNPLMSRNEEFLQYQPNFGSPYVNWGANGESNYQLEQRLQKTDNKLSSDQRELISRALDYLNEKGKSFYDDVHTWVAKDSSTKVRKLFDEIGIVGSTYWGGTDKRGHVIFNEKNIKVIERTTDRKKIKEWINEDYNKIKEEDD